MKQVSVDNVVSTYRFYAPLYDRVFGAIFEPGRRALAEAACSIRPNSLLEVGVGTGLTLSQYPSETEIVGIDVSSDMLDIARWRADQLPERNIQLSLMNAEHMDFPDGYFDCVALPYVLSVTPNPEKRSRIDDTVKYREFLRNLYTHRRKNLRAAISGWPTGKLEKPKVDEMIASVGLDGSKRAEMLSLDDHYRLYSRFRQVF